MTNLTRNQERFERIVETKFYDLDVKITEIQTVVENLKEFAEDRDTIDAFQRVLRGPRSLAMPVVEPRPTLSEPASTATVVP